MIAMRVPALVLSVEGFTIDVWRCWTDKGDSFYEGPC
jgi:hypothetical protein